AVEETTHFADQGQRISGARMAAGARRHQNEAVHAAFQRFLCMTYGGDVVKYLAAPGMDSVHDAMRGTEAGNDDGHTVLLTYGEIRLDTLIRAVNDQVDGVRGNDAIRVFAPGIFQCALNSRQPWCELRLRPCVQCRHGAHDAAQALRNDQIRTRHDEHGRTDDRQPQLTIELGNDRVHANIFL